MKARFGNTSPVVWSGNQCMIESLLFKQMPLVLPSGIFQGDLLIRSGKIEAIGPSLNVSAERIIHEPGLTVLPGLIDAHVHFREPGPTHKETIQTGSEAAAAGGITTFFEMPNTTPMTVDQVTLDQKNKIAAETALVNYAFFIGATSQNLHKLDAITGIPGIKLFAGSSTGDLLLSEPDQWERLFVSTRHRISVHSEDESIIQTRQATSTGNETAKDHPQMRPSEAAIRCTKRLTQLAIRHQKQLHICHLTTAEEAQYLQQLNSPYITCEVTPQHLFCNSDDYLKWGTYLQINPPIRDARHQSALWKALLSGTIPMIASDHAPHQRDEKEQPYGKAPSGMPIVQLTVPLLLDAMNSGQFKLDDIVRWCAYNPSEIYGIANKGRLAVGYDADITLVDLKRTRTVQSSQLLSKSNWSVFEGKTLTGWPIMTIVNGQLVYEDGACYANPHSAQAAKFHTVV